MKIKVKRSIKYIVEHVFIFAPFFCALIFLVLCKINSLYPFGNKTIAWCDMEQQVIPLLNDFKDILSGKQNFTYNMQNAGGMSFFGVFFFFLCSPFTFLVVFVDKIDMSRFMNILVMLKMCLASLSAGFYFYKKRRNTNPLLALSFSILYAFSGYVMMYYQNIIWLDCLALFPMLLYSIDDLFENGKTIGYTIIVTMAVIINYYIGGIEVGFILLYVGIIILLRRKEEKIKRNLIRFWIASIIGALMSACVIIPSFIQYLHSARSTSFISSIQQSWLLTNYHTTIPLILCVAFLLPFVIKKTEKTERQIKFISLIFMTIPILIDPINRAWHFGSYMSFPCRYAFINIFLVLDLSLMTLEERHLVEEEKKNSILTKWLFLAVAGLSIVFLYIFEIIYLQKNIDSLGKYATSLWGNSTSFEALLRYYLVVVLVTFCIYILFKKEWISMRMLSVVLCALVVKECGFSFQVYMVTPAHTDESYRNYYELSNIIEDDGFYRVKTLKKIRNVNDLGGLGYNNLGHYTSLTDKEYLYTMKKLGYSSYWMEVGSYGGTTFTDALMINKYIIQGKGIGDAKYTTNNYSIVENKVFPLGIITKSDLSKYSVLKEDTRVNMQETIYSLLIGGNLHKSYNYSSLSGIVDHSTEERYSFKKTSEISEINYNIQIDGKQSLYFECFDRYSNSLTEAINDSVKISCNGNVIFSSYPTKNYNGTISLGKYEDRMVSVKITLLKDLDCKSFSLFSIDENKLNSAITNTPHAEVEYKEKSNTFTAEYTSDGDEYMFLPLPYTKGIKVRVNGKEQEVLRVFSNFCAIKLQNGKNIVKLSFSQPGLVIGIFVSSLGLCSFILYEELKKRKSVQENKNAVKIVYAFTIGLLVSVFIFFYIGTLIINIFTYV